MKSGLVELTSSVVHVDLESDFREHTFARGADRSKQNLLAWVCVWLILWTDRACDRNDDLDVILKVRRIKLEHLTVSGE